MSSAKEEGGMQLISRVAAILRTLTSTSTSLGAIARATGLPRSTVQRIVDALAAEDLVEAGAGGVRLGWGMLRLAEKAQTDIAMKARPALELLFTRTHETVDISTAHGAEVAFLDRVISDQEVRVVPFPDRPRPLHAMANGKALLSLMTDDQISRLAANGLNALTERTITDVKRLLAEIRKVRETGFAYDMEEHAPGVCAIGVSVAVPDRPIAMSLALPSYRFKTVRAQCEVALKECQKIAEEALR
jgi:DNA-binding IclR family transcriptional regulator